jgi:hypothetical protein
MKTGVVPISEFTPGIGMRVLNHTVVSELRPDKGIAAWFAVDYKIQRDRFVTMRELYFVFWQQAKHRPKCVGNGSGLGKLLIGQQYADAICLGPNRVVGDLIQAGLCQLMPVKRRGEARNGRRDTQIAKQWRVMHPVDAGLAVAVVKGLVVRRKHDEIAFLPENGLPAGIGSARAAIDKEQLAGGLDGGLDGPLGDADKIRAQDRTGGG